MQNDGGAIVRSLSMWWPINQVDVDFLFVFDRFLKAAANAEVCRCWGYIALEVYV